MKKRLISLVLICVLMLGAIPVRAEEVMQSYINLTMGSDQTQLNVTWYSDFSDEASVIYCKASELKDNVIPDEAMTAIAVSDIADEGEGYYNHKAIVTGLEPSTEYAYALVNGDHTGPVRCFTTGDSDEYGFALLGDAQLGSGETLEGDIAAWQHTLGLIENDPAFDGADFILSAGDQVDTCNSEEHFSAFLNQDLISKMPIATVIGNHETDSELYSYHFNPANFSDEYGVTGAGGDSWFRYNDTLFVVLNTSAGTDHGEFVKNAVALNSDVRWRVAVFHHTVYTVSERAEDSSTLSRREWITSLLKEYDFDIALSGHDHIYSRSYLMDGMEPMTDSSFYDSEAMSSATDTEGIPYITLNSSTGSKYYDVMFPDVKEIAVYNQEYTPNLSMVKVTDTSFTVTTYRTADMSVVDSFTLNKAPERIDMPFEDVKESHWYHSAVEFVFSKGMMSGMSETRFGPNVTTNRAMLVSVLWRYEGCPEGFSHSFSDVKPNHYFDKAVAWAYENNIVAGKSADKYAPNDSLSREQMAAILYRYANYKDMDTDTKADISVFTDLAKLDGYAVDAVKWAYGKGIITGMNETTLDPNGSATRAQLASILMRFL